MVQHLKTNVQSIRDSLKRIAVERGSRYSDIESMFLLERMAHRIVSLDSLRDCIVFKGGFVSLRVYESNRYTIDLDALLVGRSLDSVVGELRDQVEAPSSDGVWFSFQSSVDLQTLGEGGARLNFRGGIGKKPKNLVKTQKLHLDIGVGDPVSPNPRVLNTSMIIDEGSLSWQVYPVETTVAEKIQTLLARGSDNSRSKDVYDIRLLIDQTDDEALRDALRRTFSYRGTDMPGSIAEALRGVDTSVLERGWRGALKGLSVSLDFRQVWDELVQVLDDRGF